MSQNTCECRIFCREVQSAIEQGRIKFNAPAKLMKIDGHPFPANMVEVKDQDAEMGTKVQTFDRAKRLGAVDPRVHISADQFRGRSRYDQGGDPKKPRRVTSWILLNKYQW